MNKRIIIEGEKVHHVGYRPFLLAKAWELGIPNYFARNAKEGGMEMVEISIGSEEGQIKEFLEFIKDNYPSKAKVSRVREGKLPERVMPIDKYDRVLAAEQQNTVVQTGLEMVGIQKETVEMQEKTVEMQKETIDEVKTVGVKVDNVANKIGNFASETSQNFSILKEDYGKISHTMEKILERLTQQQKDFTEAINRLTNAILKLAEKATK